MKLHTERNSLATSIAQIDGYPPGHWQKVVDSTIRFYANCILLVANIPNHSVQIPITY